jgi:hypothetical protein
MATRKDWESGRWGDVERKNRCVSPSPHLPISPSVAMAAVLAVAFLVASGYGEELPTDYGQRQGPGASQSVNGTLVFSRMFETAGHRVSSWTSLSPRLDEADCIVWFPDDFNPPGANVVDWFDRWLAARPNRTLIYVGRDFSAAPWYWRKMESLAPASQRETISAAGDEAEASFQQRRPAAESRQSCRWFTIKYHAHGGPVTHVTSDDHEWESVIDPAKLEIESNSGMTPGVDMDTLLDSDQGMVIGRLGQPNQSQLVVVSNGSFLLNAMLVNHEHRKLAGKLIDAVGRGGQDVVFLESGHLEADQPASTPSSPGQGRDQLQTRPSPGETRHAGFNDQITLGGLFDIILSRQKVMRLKLLDKNTKEVYPMRDDIYLRGSAVAWYSQNHWRRDLPPEAILGAVAGPLAPPVVQRITMEPNLDRDDMFYVWPLIEPVDRRLVFIAGSERLTRKPGSSEEARLESLTCDIETSGLVEGHQAELIPVGREFNERPFLQMPGEPWALPRVTALAAKWFEESGLAANEHYEIARFFERQLSSSGQFQYSLQGQERDPSIDAIEDFVSNNPRGHCEYFATALALMLRSQNIPTRVVLGYHCDEWHADQKYYQVRQLHAHAWVEAFLAPEQVPETLRESDPKRWRYGGWLRLDPTPAADIGSNAKLPPLSPRDPPIRNEDVPPQPPTGLELLLVWPTNWVLLHFAMIGVLFCLWKLPIFGLPRPQDPQRASDFGRHVDAVAALLKRADDPQYARMRIEQYQQVVKRSE